MRTILDIAGADVGLSPRSDYSVGILATVLVLCCVGVCARSLADPGSGDVTIRGVSLRVAPADPEDQLIRPRNAPVLLGTKVEDGSGTDVSGDDLFLDTVVVGRLSGNNINQDISAPLGSNLEIGTTTESAGDLIVGAPLLEPGNYTLDNLRPESPAEPVDAASAERAVSRSAGRTSARPPPETEGYVRQRHYAWADLLKRTFAVDVLDCPECGGRLRLLATITQREVIEKILGHLGLPSEPIVPEPVRVQDDLFG